MIGWIWTATLVGIFAGSILGGHVVRKVRERREARRALRKARIDAEQRAHDQRIHDMREHHLGKLRQAGLSDEDLRRLGLTQVN